MEEYKPIPLRRTATRFKLGTEGKLFLEEKEKLIICQDVSGRGLGAISSKPLNINEKVKVEIFIPWAKRQLIKKEGKVVWCREMDKDWYRFGVEFGTDDIFH